MRKIVSGLIKLLHPDGEVSQEQMEEYLTYAMEMRRRVKEQLKKMGVGIGPTIPLKMQNQVQHL